MKPFAFLAIPILFGVAAAQPVPQQKIVKVEAEVILIGRPAHPAAVCGRIVNIQEIAIKITKVAAGPVKVGDTPVLKIMTCFEGPLLRRAHPADVSVELDQSKIRRGSKLELEFVAYGSSNTATTDKIIVTKL